MSGEVAKPTRWPIAALAYIGFFVTGILILYWEPYNQDEFIRFHARQSIGFSVVWIAILIVFGVFISILPFALGRLLGDIQVLVNLALAIFWLFLIYKAYTGERYRIPELADIVDNIAGQSASH